MVHRTLPLYIATLFGLSCATVNAQSSSPKEEITFITNARTLPDRDVQAELRQRNGWRQFKAQHPRWSVEFNEASAMPRKAYGPPIVLSGTTPQEVATAFLAAELTGFGLPVEELVLNTVAPTGKLTYVHFGQVHDGLTVLGAKAMVKLDAQGRVIAFAADVHKDIATSPVPGIAEPLAMSTAEQGLSDITTSEYVGLRFLPIPTHREVDMRLVHEVVVRTQRGDTPGRFRCLVDANTGHLWYRTNEVLNCDHGEGNDAGADVQMRATAYTGSPLQPTQVQDLPEIDVTVNGSLFQTDTDGFLASGIPGPAPTVFQLRGRWANVSTSGVTPTFNGSLNEGSNTVTFDLNSNVRERSAYIYTNQIHSHLKAVLPDFTGMDFTLPVRLDLTTDNCNAFYDGSSINFYAEANNCRSLATINDVVYHEYGHGINNTFYSSLSSSFTNGGMNEGYADVWAMTLTQSPIVGLGINLDNDNSVVRRYDEQPRVYPVDLVGQVHADGMIICGAWWDTYQLLGNDMELTLDLFAQAYPGLQANTFNGNEGQAFRDVLLDVLQADDNDGDITNGTPNGDAIVEAFAIHGITLISDADLFHDGLLTAPEETAIAISADVIITFPSSSYLANASVFYRVNDADEWTSAPMTTTDGTGYNGVIPPQPIGTVVSYYLGLQDIFGQTSSITPVAADRVDPGLPYHIMVGYGLLATENADNLSELGPWVEGINEDNATTGHWEFGAPIGSYSDPNDLSTVVQPGGQHTLGGELCWYTGNANNALAPLGENDVDGGSTTLLGPTIDLTEYANPAISYWRWYTNNPPSGANPNADWWQVYASSNGGSTWVPVEDTKTGERNWRRNVFRVQDVLGDVTSIRLKFIASDSIRAGQELDGGSLVEAALDDIELWDEVAGTGQQEFGNTGVLAVWPIPANDFITVSMRNVQADVHVEVLDMTGRTVLQPATVAAGNALFQVHVGGLAIGQYMVRVHGSGGTSDHRFTIVR